MLRMDVLLVAQYSASERWLRREPVYERATAARELPPHVLLLNQAMTRSFFFRRQGGACFYPAAILI